MLTFISVILFQYLNDIFIIFRPKTTDGNIPTTPAVSVRNVKDVNNNITAIEPDGDPCVRCNRYPHPVGAVNHLDAKLQLSFPLRCTDAPTTRKSSRIVTYGRVISSEEILKQVKVIAKQQKYI